MKFRQVKIDHRDVGTRIPDFAERRFPVGHARHDLEILGTGENRGKTIPAECVVIGEKYSHSVI
jgi:hypothetical protein